MLESWGSDLIVGLFALLFGATLRIFALLAPPPQRAGKREGESWRQVAMRQAEVGTHLPTSAKLATLALYGLVAVTWVSIAVSPVEMRWLAFAVGAALGWGILETVFRVAKRTAPAPRGSSPA